MECAYQGMAKALYLVLEDGRTVKCEGVYVAGRWVVANGEAKLYLETRGSSPETNAALTHCAKKWIAAELEMDPRVNDKGAIFDTVELEPLDAATVKMVEEGSKR